MCSLLLTHPSTRSLVLGAVGSYCTALGEQWEWGGGEGCPVPCSRAPQQGRRWTGTSPSSSPHSMFRSGRGLEPATLRLRVKAPTDWATAGHVLMFRKHIILLLLLFKYTCVHPLSEMFHLSTCLFKPPAKKAHVFLKPWVEILRGGGGGLL